MRKADLVNLIADKTGIPKVDVLVTLETMFKEVKETLSQGENIYIRGFGSFITKNSANCWYTFNCWALTSPRTTAFSSPFTYES